MLKKLFDRRMGRYRLDQPVRVNHPMILISQIQRSGGTLLSRLFDDHPEIFAHPYELTWGRPEKWNWPDIDLTLPAAKLFKLLDQDWVERLARKAYYKKGPKKVTGTYPFIFDRSVQHDIFVQLHKSMPPKSQRDVLDHYMTSFFNAWYDYQDLYRREKRFLTAFTPRTVMYDDSVERFDRDYPDGYMISSVRHPGGWYASAVRHKYDTRDGVAGVLDFWIKSTEAILAAKSRLGPRLIVLSFEELVADPGGAMRLVCARTNLPWNDSLMKPTFNGMPILSDSHFDAVTHIDAGAGERFRATLPEDIQTEIEDIAGALHREARALIGRETSSPGQEVEGQEQSSIMPVA